MLTRITTWLGALGAATATAITPSPTITAAQHAVRQDLEATKAASTAALTPELAARVIGPGLPSVLPLAGGRTLTVPIVLEAAGGPFRVHTELGLTYSVSVGGGEVTIARRPSRDDLAAAVRLSAKCEARVLDAAGKALDAAGRRPPLGSWASALTTVRLDPRLPRDQLVGPTTWQLLFEPPVKSGGWNSVTLDAEHCGVVTVNGKSL